MCVFVCVVRGSDVLCAFSFFGVLGVFVSGVHIILEYDVFHFILLSMRVQFFSPRFFHFFFCSLSSGSRALLME